MAELPSPIAAQPAMCSTPVRPGAGDAAAPEEISMDELLRDAGIRKQPTSGPFWPWSVPGSPWITAGNDTTLSIDTCLTMEKHQNMVKQQEKAQTGAHCSCECAATLDGIQAELLHMKNTIEHQGKVIETLKQNDIDEKKRKLEEGQGNNGFFGPFGCLIM